jgi:hypothetical protein
MPSGSTRFHDEVELVRNVFGRTIEPRWLPSQPPQPLGPVCGHPELNVCYTGEDDGTDLERLLPPKVA